MTLRRLSEGLVAAILAIATPAAAQTPDTAPAVERARAADTAGRARLEGEVRRGFARAVRQRVGLSDEQMRQLRPVTVRYEQQRRQLHAEERETRRALRASMQAEGTADGARIDQLLRRLIDIQKRRVQLIESEQSDLATIMTPVQRARYMALQEQVRRRLEQMRQRRGP